MLLGIAAVGGPACAGILGIEDRTPDPLADASMGGLESGLAEGASDGGTGTDAPSGADGAGADGASTDGVSTADVVGTDAARDSAGDAAGDAAADATGDAATDAPSCPDPCRLATGLNHPFLMASDAKNVYWTEFGDTHGSGNGYVKGCPVTGCGSSGPLVYAQGLTNPRGVATDGKNVYFATATYSGVTGGIWSCPVAGCGASGPTSLSSAVIPYGVAVDSSYVYWVDNNDGTVHKVAKMAGTDGGTDIVLYDGGPYDDAGNTFSELGQCVVDGPFLYFGDYSEDVIRLSVNGDTPTLLGNGVNNSVYGSYFGITTDSTSVYSGGNGIILRASKTVADSGAPIANAIALPLGLAFDPPSGLIYWASWGSGNSNDGTVGRSSTDGGAQRVLQSSLVTPEAVTVSGNYVLWLSNGTLSTGGGTAPSTGALWRTAK
jgi:hypothetical protein